MIMNIMSAYSEKPIGTFLWTLGIGYWIAVMDWLLKETRERSALVQRFGLALWYRELLADLQFFCVAIPETLYMECFIAGYPWCAVYNVGIWIASKLSSKWHWSGLSSLRTSLSGGFLNVLKALFWEVMITSSSKSRDHIESHHPSLVKSATLFLRTLPYLCFWISSAIQYFWWESIREINRKRGWMDKKMGKPPHSKWKIAIFQTYSLKGLFHFFQVSSGSNFFMALQFSQYLTQILSYIT